MDQIHFTRILYDFILLVVLLLALIYTKFFLKPFQSGFYCNDFSINMPFKSSTVTNTVLQILSLGLSLIIISLTEVFRTIYMKVKNSTLHMRNRYRILFCGKKTLQLPEQVGNILINYFAFLFGLLCNVNLTNIGKKTIGRLRPNFLDVCKPAQNPFSTLCQTYVTGKTYLLPEIDFQCLSPDKAAIQESRLSFPSGHASTVCYTAVFLILFINKTWSQKNIGFFPQFVQFLLISMAFFTSLSRVIDNKHHPTDVAAGAVLGTLVAIFTFYYLNQFFKKYNFKIKYNTIQYGGELRLKENDLNENESQETQNKSKKCYGSKVV